MMETARKIYYSAEERYYSILDDANKVAPVYDVLWHIDIHFPSFVLFLAGIAVLAVIIAH
ncbi:MAG: hypothetical protein V1676_03690 [Candidatus Diapherotrites archaeon]